MSLFCTSNAVSLHTAARILTRNGENAVAAGSEIPAGSWSLPPNALPSKEKIPSSSLFKSLFDDAEIPGNSSSPRLPTVGECAAHLQLLQAFYQLRRNVLESPGLNQVWELNENIPSPSDGTDPQLDASRREKWSFFIKLAALRFLDWLESADLHLSHASPDQKTIDVPSLDILMVWHSFLLKPREFRTLCSDHGYNHVRDAEFPWKGIHSMINNFDWSFNIRDYSFTHARSLKTKVLLDYLSATEKSQLIHDIINDLLNAKLPERDIGRIIGRTEHLKVTHPNFLSESCKGIPGTKAGNRVSAALGIAAIVDRPTSFLDRIEHIQWISSPAISATLQRAIERYARLIGLSGLYPDASLLPTLDIQLAWHTHQCSASRYEAEMQTTADRILDDDYGLSSAAAQTAKTQTADLWRIRYGQQYDTCHCWDCEALVSAAIEIGQHQKGMGKWSTEGVGTESVTQAVGDYLTYYRYMEAARRLDKPLPPQADGR